MDATTGQNGLAQAREFNAALGLDGIVLTKLDGTAKGGIAVAIARELRIPILRIGVGEGLEDLQAVRRRRRSRGRSSVVSDDLYIGPTLSGARGAATRRPDRAAGSSWPLLVAALVVIIVFYVLYSPLQVAGESMEPTLRDGDRAAASRRATTTPRAATSSSFDAAHAAADDDDLVKRVIALPGDTVEIRDDVALVNGAVEDSRAERSLERHEAPIGSPSVVPAGHVYVLGRQPARSRWTAAIIGSCPARPVHGQGRLRLPAAEPHRTRRHCGPLTASRMPPLGCDAPPTPKESCTACSRTSPTACRRSSRTSPARADSPRPTSTPPCARSAWRCSRPT